MAIYDHKYGELPYFRVYRSWGGKEYQEYVRIKRSRNKAYAEAKAIDERMAREQRAYMVAQSKLPSYHVREDGTIRGLRRITVTRKGREPTEVYELRINVPWEESVKRTTISIPVHGEEAGFAMAVAKICEWYGLENESDAHLHMLEQLAVYAKNPNSQGIAEAAIQRAKGLTGGLIKGIRRFSNTGEDV